MGKVGQLVMEAQQFAQDHYNMNRDDFYKHAAAYQWEYSIQLREAVSHWEEIQTDMALWNDAMEQYVEDPESPLYADNDLAPEDYNLDVEEGRREYPVF